MKWIIEARLNLQSTQTALKQVLGFTVPGLATISSDKFKLKFSQLDEMDQKRVLSLIGGKVNLKKTREFIGRTTITAETI